jgi:hypothetical protein
MSIPKRRLSATTRTARPTHQSSNSAVGSKDTIAQPLQIRRRIRHNDSNRIIVRDNRAQSPLRQTFKPLISGTHIQQIRAESPIGPRLVDRVPLAIRFEIRIAKVVSLAWRDEIEIERAVGVEGACVGRPVEAAGRLGVACVLEFRHGWGVL